MATAPQKKGLVRITQASTKRPKSSPIGRPKGTVTKREFEETKVGCFMKIAAPLEYDIIMKSLPSGPFKLPLPEIVRIVAKASGNRVLMSTMFFKFLEYYETNGAYQPRKSKPTPELIRIYTKRKEDADRYVAENSRNKIARFKKARGGF